MNHSCKCVNINEQKINLQFWDTPGHECFGGITRVHYKVRNSLFSEIGNMLLSLELPNIYHMALPAFFPLEKKI